MSAINKWSSQYEKCIKCNSVNSPHKAKGLCTACYQKEHSYPQNLCSVCGTLARVHKRVDGKAICRKCYKEPVHICNNCGKESSAAYKLNNAEFICDSCYIKHYRKKQLCSICSHIEVLAINTDNKKICVKCYPTLNNSCFKCGRNIKSPYVVDGNHVCNRCYENTRQNNRVSMLDVNKELYICNVCGKSGEVQRKYNDGSVICQSCYKQRPDICTSCSNLMFPIYSHLNALPYCRNCYYKQKFGDMFTKLKKNWSECFTNIMEDYFNNKALKVSYETIWEHLRVSEALLNDLFSEFANNGSSFLISSLLHIIKKHSRRKLFINDFIAFLCSKGILSDYDNGLALLNNLNEQIDKLPAKFQKVIITYKDELLQKLSKFQEKGWIKGDSRFTYYTCYLYILTALRFLFFANTLNLQQPTEINNHTVDAFIRLKPYDKGNLRHFIVYINKNKITFMNLTLPDSNYRHELHISISDDKQRQLFETCLYNKDILLRDRIIIILMLLYCITPEEIRTLKKSNFAINKYKSKTKILLCNNRTKHEMPSVISSLMIEYINSLNQCYEYVFPGRYFNTPISLSSICLIMKKFMVTATELYYTSINNAMLNGLHQPALLMKGFGISNMTATRYYKLIRNIL